MFVQAMHQVLSLAEPTDFLSQCTALLSHSLGTGGQGVAGSSLSFLASPFHLIDDDAFESQPFTALLGGAIGAVDLPDDGAHRGEAQRGFVHDAAQ